MPACSALLLCQCYKSFSNFVQAAGFQWKNPLRVWGNLSFNETPRLAHLELSWAVAYPTPTRRRRRRWRPQPIGACKVLMKPAWKRLPGINLLCRSSVGAGDCLCRWMYVGALVVVFALMAGVDCRLALIKLEFAAEHTPWVDIIGECFHCCCLLRSTKVWRRQPHGVADITYH